MNMEEKTISSSLIYDGKIIKVYVDQVTLPTGRTSKREVIRGCKASAVLALNEKGEVIMEKQYRYAYQQIMNEIPAGKADKGEDPLTTAKRELEEETGYQAEKWTHLGTFYPTVAYTDEVIEIYLAENLIKTHQHLDEGETLSYEFIPFEEMKAMAKDGRIKDGKTLAALAYALLKD